MRIRILLVFLLVFVVGSSVSAQDEELEAEPVDNGDWRVYEELDLVTFRLPPDWADFPETALDAEFTTPNGGAMNVQVQFVGDVLSMEEIQEQTNVDPQGGQLLEQRIVSFPFGDAVLNDSIYSNETGMQSLGEGMELRQHQYYFPVGSSVVLMTFGALQAPNDAFALEQGTYSKVMRTVQRDEATVGDPDWPAYSTNDGILTVQAPPDFEDAETDAPTGLTLRQPEDFTLVIISSTELDEALDLAGFEGALVRGYEDDGAAVVQSAIINLPIGDTVFIHADTELVLDDGTTIPQQEYRYLTMRGNRMINVTLIVDTPLYADYVGTFIAIMDTLRLNEAEETADE